MTEQGIHLSFQHGRDPFQPGSHATWLAPGDFIPLQPRDVAEFHPCLGGELAHAQPRVQARPSQRVGRLTEQPPFGPGHPFPRVEVIHPDLEGLCQAWKGYKKWRGDPRDAATGDIADGLQLGAGLGRQILKRHSAQRHEKTHPGQDVAWRRAFGRSLQT
jgi:hypothetical protein